ncbi:MAG TPA: tRNA(Ile)-lysidine synthetase [Acidimicrobiales bacterium]|nr:tRNA(Ile)-lysidine synthetase [Acidimicrobiales bacterium]
MKCTVCRGPAVIDLRRHNANFCPDHFLKFCRDQVARAIDEHHMIEPGERVLVAVSGGKDSLALWDLLLELGYDAEGMTIGLGIGDYSAASTEAAVGFAERRGLELRLIDLRDDFDYDVPTASAVTRRVPCSSCGLSKRHLIDTAALDGGYDVVATGHNLDDETAVLLGNVLHWHTEYLGRQQPVLGERTGFPRKVKPLVRLAERETAAYCVLRGIDYIVDECPMAEGNRHLRYKEALNAIEADSPGAKQAFYFGFLARAADRFSPEVDAAQQALRPCARCGSPTTGEVCAFCRLVDQVAGEDPVPVELVRPGRAGVLSERPGGRESERGSSGPLRSSKSGKRRR